MRFSTGLWTILGLAAVAAVVPGDRRTRDGLADSEGPNRGEPDQAIDKFELANVELQAHKDLYSQAVEGLKTVPTRIAPLFAFGAALIGFLATSVIKEFGPELVNRPEMAVYLQGGIVLVIVFTTLSLIISGAVLAQVAAVVYMPPDQKLKHFLQSTGEIGLYVEEGARVASEIVDSADYDPKSAVVMYQAEIVSRQARALLVALGRARRCIGWSVTCLIIAFSVTITGFSYCVTQLGLGTAASATRSVTTVTAAGSQPSPLVPTQGPKDPAKKTNSNSP